jgi:uncharacterized protein (DUF2141 family)
MIFALLLYFMPTNTATTANMQVYFDPSCISSEAQNLAMLSINIHNITQSSGQLMVSVYNSHEDFMNIDRAVFKKNYPISKTGTFAFSIPALPEGAYAISCFHDLNNNGILDKNLLGIPSEPYGFSQNARPKFRAPVWDEAKFWFSGQAVDIKIEKW